MGSPLFHTKKGPKRTTGKVQVVGRCCGPDRYKSPLIPPEVGVMEPGVLPRSRTALSGAAEALGAAAGGTAVRPWTWPARTGRCPPRHPGREPAGSPPRREQGTTSRGQAWHHTSPGTALCPFCPGPGSRQPAEKRPPARPSATPRPPACSLKWFFASWLRVSQRRPVRPLLSA